MIIIFKNGKLDLLEKSDVYTSVLNYIYIYLYIFLLYITELYRK